MKVICILLGNSLANKIESKYLLRKKFARGIAHALKAVSAE